MRLPIPPSWILIPLCACTGVDEVSPSPVVAGGGSLLPAPLLLEQFQRSAPMATCGEMDGPGWLLTLSPVRGGGFLGLDRTGTVVSELDEFLRPIRRIQLPREGDQAIRDPVDAWLLGDTLVVADAGGRALHLLPWGDPGETFRRIPLAFVPHALVGLGSHLGVVPLGGRAESMLLRRTGDGFIPLPLPPPSLPDPRLRLLAGALETTVVGEGTAVLGHPLLVPSLYRIDGESVTRSPAPVPDGQERAVGRVPRPPFDEDDILDLLAPALDLTPGPGDSSLLVLTRSGGWTGGFREKAVLHLQLPGFEVQGALRLPLNAVLLGGGALDALRAMDADGHWHLCRSPGPVAGSVPSRHGADLDGDA